MIYPWHQSAWDDLWRNGPRSHHAVLLHGPAGNGKRHFACIYAQSQLCVNTDGRGYACGHCDDCRWYLQQSHPDFRLVTPEAMRPESLTPVDTSSDQAGRADKRKPSNQITIEQVRELRDFLSLTAHRSGGLRVVVMQPADRMNSPAANALLKLLEEPPAGTLFLLVSDEIRRLLPTVLSRCRRYPMPSAPRAEAASWLTKRGLKDPDGLLAQAGGAPLSALEIAAPEYQAERRQFLDQLARLDGANGALELAAMAYKLSLPSVLRWLATWCYDLTAARLAGAIRYHPDYEKHIHDCARRVALDRLLVYQDLLKSAVRSVDHPLNPRLFLERLLLSYLPLTPKFENA
jgi:DNA polymerase-3 subunit delta'